MKGGHEWSGLVTTLDSSCDISNAIVSSTCPEPPTPASVLIKDMINE